MSAKDLATLIGSLEDLDLVEFFDDCIKYLRGIRVPFLTKYRERFGGSAF